MITEYPKDKQIVIFDSVCNFCNGSVHFIIRRDPKAVFLFAPMQSDVGKKIIQKHHTGIGDGDTILLVKDRQIYDRSDAALEIAKELSGLWYLLGIFRFIPRPIRDYLYKLFARNRYRLFGKKENCMIPSDATKERFLS